MVKLYSSPYFGLAPAVVGKNGRMLNVPFELPGKAMFMVLSKTTLSATKGHLLPTMAMVPMPLKE